MTILLLLLGMAMLLAGGRLLVESAVGVAGRLGVPPLLVGLTLVAWGTSTPEVALNFTAAFQDRPGLVFGNTIGANICNLGLVLGLCALVRPLVCETAIVRRELPITLLVLGSVLVLALLPLPTPWHLGAAEGAALLAGFLVYSIVTIRQSLRVTDPVELETVRSVEQEETRKAHRPIWLLVALLVAGLALLSVGGDVAAGAASDLARQLGMSEKTIGLTVVAVGTTLPELATSFMAIRAGQVDLAVGNALGSCLFNVGFILAVATLIAPIGIPDGGVRALLTMVGLATALVVISVAGRGRIGRPAGALLLAAYVGSVAWELMTG